MKRIESPTSGKSSQRDKIVAVARDLFWRQGYKETTLDDVAASVHCNKAMVYYYFKRKSDILYEIGMGFLNGIMDQQMPVLKSDMEPEAKVKRLVANHIEWELAHVGLFGVHTLGHLPPRQFRSYMRLRDKYEDVFRTVLWEMGVKQEKECKLVTTLLLGLLNSITLWYRIDGDLSPKDITAKVWALLSGGVGARSPHASRRVESGNGQGSGAAASRRGVKRLSRR